MAITIYDVAQHARVSTSTISRYLNGQGVREKNRLQIEQAIHALGFKQNIIAHGLKRKRLMSIAVLVPNYTVFFMTITAILEKILARENYSLLLGNFEDCYDVLQQKLDFVEERFVDGFILFSSGIQQEMTSRLQQYIDNRFPIVLVEQDIQGLTTDMVGINNAHAAFRAVEKLIHENHTQIAIVNGDDRRYIFKERLHGYYNAMHAYNLPIEPQWIISRPFIDMKDISVIQNLFTAPQPPTAIFAATYYATMSTIIALHQLRLRIPDDVSLIGFDLFDAIDALDPPLTLVTQPFEKIAEATADLLLKRLRGDYTDFPQTVILNTQMLMRESIKRL